jgi:hypothetical protein
MSRYGAVNQREAQAQSNTRRISRRTLFTSSHAPQLGRGSTMTPEKRTRPEAVIVRRCLTCGKCDGVCQRAAHGHDVNRPRLAPFHHGLCDSGGKAQIGRAIGQLYPNAPNRAQAFGVVHFGRCGGAECGGKGLNRVLQSRKMVGVVVEDVADFLVGQQDAAAGWQRDPIGVLPSDPPGAVECEDGAGGVGAARGQGFDDGPRAQRQGEGSTAFPSQTLYARIRPAKQQTMTVSGMTDFTAQADAA